ncbi:hypothetical protein [Kribbella italica]|uniref:Uncharacterized protein n=1 Tax=Kribbella italica TaxID=1540520 RepID=A0A7W9MUK8_9ACTN|nr:hypothetical protein [Kribbella italica]MBB5836073.1 hypothetical protein [Kribbella italica]
MRSVRTASQYVEAEGRHVIALDVLCDRVKAAVDLTPPASMTAPDLRDPTDAVADD